MKMNRAYAVMLMVAVMITGLAMGTPRPARADDTGAFIAGAVLGVLLDNVFDNDYPNGFSFGYSSGYGPGYGGGFGYGSGYGDGYNRPGWWSWPEAGVFALPEYARPYPYDHRWWEFGGTFRGRQVFVPATCEPFGFREFVMFPSRPIFVQPRVASTWYGPTQNWGRYSRFGNRWDVFGQYGWTPAPRLRVYRVPTDRRWYDGPDPDDWRERREHSQPYRPNPKDMYPLRDHTWPQTSDRDGKGRPGQTWQDRSEPGRKGTPGQTWQSRPDPAWKGEFGERREEGRPQMSFKTTSDDDRGGQRGAALKPTTPTRPRGESWRPTTPVRARDESLKPATPVRARDEGLKPTTPTRVRGESLKPATTPKAKKGQAVVPQRRSEKDRDEKD